VVAVCDSLRSVLFVVVIFERSRERTKIEGESEERGSKEREQREKENVRRERG
jgi:hypothetical protein